MGNTRGAEWECDAGWAEGEFSKVEVCDERLKKRLVKVAEDLSALPQAPINQASKDWAATKAAYRLFSNENVKEEELFKAHQLRTRARIRGEETILAIQDTTYLNYDSHDACQGLGYVGTEALKGIILHHTLAVTPLGLPLGLLTQKKTTRLKLRRLTNKERYALPIEDKESFRWVEALRATVAVAKNVNRVVTVCDREGDFYEMLAEATRLNTYYLIRATADRLALKEGQKVRVSDILSETGISGKIAVNVPAREGRKKRTAVVEVKYTSVALLRPGRSEANAALLPDSLASSVLAIEERFPPSGVEPLRWILYTNVAIASFEDALERIQWYKSRWQIETYHKVLKSGCKVEDCRLESIDRLCLYLTMFGIIAWRIFWFTHISRAHPNEPASVVLAKAELEALRLLAAGKDRASLKISTARQAVIEVAKLGGFLARRHDGHPGPTVIWRGWQRLSDATEMYEIMAPQLCG